MVAIAAAGEADRGELEAYLAARSDTCMLLRSNLHVVGLAWSPPGGAALQAEYVIGRRVGAVIGVAAHAWNGNLLVQADGVFTPPALRGRGHARAVVAASLLDARAEGKRRAVLFTPRPDAVAAYRAVGFDAIGRYAVVLFEPAQASRV